MLKEIIIELIKAESREGKTDKTKVHNGIGLNFISKKCMIRTYSAGVHFGEVVEHCKKEVVLKNAYRVHYWDGACSLSQLATEGSKKRENCRISVPVSEIYLSEAIEIITMTETAYQNLVNAGELWKIE